MPFRVVHLLFAAASCLQFSYAIRSVPNQLIRRQDVNTDHLRGLKFHKDSCESSHLEKIVKAFDDVQELANSAVDIDINDEWFITFFGTGWERKPSSLDTIKRSFRAVGSYPTDGYSGVGADDMRIGIRCDDPEDRCKRNGVTAYTYRVGDNTHDAMAFCDRFFENSLPHIEKKVLKPPTTDLIHLITREHVILHELLHCKTIISDISIKDSQVNIGGTDYLMYGAQGCSYVVKALGGGFSRDAIHNADSYAWLATAKYFSDRWQVKLNLEPQGVRGRDSSDGTDLYGETDLIGPSDPGWPVPSELEDPPPDPVPNPGPTYSCDKDCCGFVPDPDFCNKNCGGPRC